jgi:oligoendopeptidase F
MSSTAERSSAAGVRWDLSGIFADATAAREALAAAIVRASALEERVAGIDELDAAELRDLLDEASSLAGLRDVLDADYGYAGLRVLADSADGEARDLAAECEPGVGVIRDGLRAVSLAVGVRPLLSEVPELAPYRHWLEHQVALSAGRLDPAAERAFAARAGSASSAWGRLSQEILTAASISFDAGDGEKPHGVTELQLLAFSADRDVRRRAAEALLGIYEENLPVASACLDAVVSDRLAEDRLRGRSGPLEATLAADEVDAATVELMLETVEARKGILTDWYERKRCALGLEEIESYDRRAPVGEPPPIPWQDAVDASRRVFAELSPRLDAVAAHIFDRRLVDAERRPGKDGAIFCAGFPEEYGSVLFLSYLESAFGASMVAHELGHAVHYGVARMSRPWLAMVEPETMAFWEVPSTFAELMTAEYLSATIGGEGGKAILQAGLEGIMVVVFGASVMTRFEQDVCARRSAGEALTPARIAEIWQTRDEALFGRLARPLGVLGHPHPFIARFYGYQYTYATLASLALAAVRRDDPERFAVDYVAMLEATGSGTPAELLALCGVDVDDPRIWRRSLDELERLCELAW